MRRNHLKANLAQMKANKRFTELDKTMEEALAQSLLDEEHRVRHLEPGVGITWMTQEEADRQAELDEQHNYQEGDAVRYIPTPVKPSLWERLKGMM